MISPAETPDEDLVRGAQSGSREAAELLLARHQPWVLNLAVRMMPRRADAEDASQEVPIKAFQSLPTFRGGSQFRTWLYRIAVNHILNARKAVASLCSFEDAARGLQRVPDLDLPDPRTVPVPVEMLIEETRIVCTMGTLLCLDGRQRLVFILGEVFGVSDEVGAEIAGVSPVNFRQILSRARRDLYEYLRGNCSLVTPGAPCKCVKKTRAFVQGGFVDPRKLQFTPEHQRKVRDVAGSRADELTDAHMKVAAQVYRDHPFYEPAGQVERLHEALKTVSLEPPA
ncbi:MAG TPA: RNA polymerase sigma factor [Bryobacteraceae bacterium]|nr:RNA polymerase sigma factor [Bryobacteraceae bacterium]